MKSSILLKIETTPLTLPYFDLDAFRAIEPMTARFRASTGEVNEKTAQEFGLDTEHVPEIVLAQFQAGRYIARKMEGMGMSSVRAVELSGMDKTMLSKYLKGKRPFTPSASVVAPFCYNVMNESCNKIMLGFEGKIVLPSMYAETAKALSRIAPEEKAELLKKAKIQLALYEKQNPSEIKNAPKRDLSVLIGERIFELIYDKGTQGYQLFGSETPYPVRNFLRQFIIEDFKRESPRLGHLMYLSLETGLALDYFIAEDFTRYTPCYYTDGDKTVLIEDREILQYIGICSSVPVEQRSKLFGDAIGAMLGQQVTA